MDVTEKLLQTSYQSAKMGASSINAILPKTQDKNMRNLLVQDLSGYDDLADRATRELSARGDEPKEKNPISQKMGDFMVQVKASADQSPSHIAEMLINGANMGIIELTKAKNDAASASPASFQIATDIVDLSHRIVEEMKPFL